MSLGAPKIQSLELISQYLAKEVSPIVYRNWIAPLVYEAQGEKLFIYTLDDFHAERIKKDFLEQLQKLVSELYPKKFDCIIIKKNPTLPHKSSNSPKKLDLVNVPETHEKLVDATQQPEPEASDIVEEMGKLIKLQKPPPRSECNDLFMRIIEDLTLNPDNYDSVYIYGPAGSGKSTYTQFLYRCLSKIMFLNTGYYTMDDFTSAMVEAIQSQSICKFRKKFKQKYQAIIIDDFHLIAKRNKTQEELAHMVHSWKAQGIKVFFISQKPLEACITNTLLQARVQSGLVIPISSPDFSLIEQMVINELGDFSTEVRHHIVNFCHNRISSLHTLKGILNRIRVEVGLCKRQLDRAAIEKIVDEFVSTSKEEDLRPAQIVQLVCQYYQVEEDMLRCKSRKKTLTEARRLTAFLLRKHTNLSLVDIGTLIGRDHTTVIHSIQKMEEDIKFSKSLHKHLKFLEEKLSVSSSEPLPAKQTVMTLH